MKKYLSGFAVVLGLLVLSTLSVHAQTSQAPTISYIGPSSATVGSTIYVYGSNYNQNTFVALDGAYGQSITPTLISPTSLSFVISSNVSLGTHSVQVNEKASSFPLSNSVSLSVVATPQPPTVSYIGPSSATVGSTVYVYGTNFNQNTFVALDGSYGQSITPTLISGTSLSFVVPANTNIGTHTLQVNEKGASFPLSNSVSLSVVATPQPPAISFITPNSVAPGATVYVYGSNFDQYSFIAYDGNYGLTIYPTSQSATYLSFTVPTNTSVGSHTIQVGQKASSLPNSNSVSLNVVSNASVKIKNPLDNYLWTMGDIQTFQWSTTGLDSSATGYIDLVGNGITYRVANVSNSGSYVWSGVGKSLTGSMPAGTYSVKIIINGIGDITGPLTLANPTQPTPTPIPTPPPVTPNKPLPADIDTQNPQGTCLDLQINLRYRMRDTATSDDILSLQDYLQANGYLHVEPTGFFGVLTLQAAKNFQQANGISPTGFVGPITRAKIKALSCQ